MLKKSVTFYEALQIKNVFAKFLVAPKKFKDLRLRQASWESFTTLNEVYGIEKVCKSNFHTWSKCAPISPWQRRMKHVLSSVG